MAATPPSQQPADSGGIHIGDVGGSVNFSALGDIVGGDKITTITTTIQISVEAVTQRPLITASPYRGLDRFEDRDKDLFFGRDQLIKSLLAQLSASNVLLVLGASGSGKSSVVRAGLLPQLAQLIGARFRYFTFVPDVNPFESLRSALQGAGFSQAQTRELADARPETPAKLMHALQRGGDQWLFFVDQFEEIFTVGDEKLRATFIAALVAIAQDPNSSMKLVLAMRADFLDRFSPFPQFAKIIEKNIDFVADMHPDELRLAIEQPAARHGVIFEQGLVEEIIKGVQGQAGSLPLLQYTLDLLWAEEAREDGLADRHLNTRAYRELGGVRGALQKRADEIYASFGDGTDAKAATPKQAVVRQIFLRLVDLAGEGSNDAAWRPVRRRASMAMFSPAREQEILQALINQKLLVSNREGDDATVEVAHEALFTSWGRLKNWIESGKQVIFARNRLADDARRWQRRQQEADTGADEELLGGSRLAQALDMRARGDFVTVVGGLGESETQFLDASLSLRDRRAHEEQLRQQRELEAAQRLAAVQKVAAGRLRKGLVIALVLLLVATGSSIVAYLNATKVKETLAQADFDLAMMYRQQSEPVDPRTLAHLASAVRNQPEARLPRLYVTSLLRDVAWCLPLIDPIRHDGKLVATSPDGRRIVIATLNSAQVSNLETGAPIGKPLRHEGEITMAYFSPDARWLVTSVDKIARIWNANSGEPVGTPLVHDDVLRTARFSADGRRIVMTAFETALVWDVEKGKIVREAFRHGFEPSPDPRIASPFVSEILGASFSPDGRWILTFSSDWTARVWDVESGKSIGKSRRHQGEILTASFSPDGKRVVTGSSDRTARLWDATSGDPIFEPWEHKGRVFAVSFSPDGRRVVTGSGNGDAQVWNAENGNPVGDAFVHRAGVTAASFSPDGRRVVTASADGTARVWDAQTGRPLTQPLRHEGAVVAASFDPEGRRIITTSSDATARIWDAETKSTADPLARHGEEDFTATFSPDGTRVLIATGETARIWNSESGQPLSAPMQHQHWGRAPRFSHDGRLIITYSDSTAMIWNAQTGQLVGEPWAQLNEVTGVSFGPDGRRFLAVVRDTVKIWDVESRQPVGDPLRHEASIVVAEFSPDGSRILTGSEDNTARIWQTESGHPITEPLPVGGKVAAVSFSFDGKRVVTGSDEGKARVWDATIGKPLTPPFGHEKALSAANFNHDASRIVTASSDGTARIWDVQSGKPVCEPLPVGDFVTAASFSADGQLIVTADSARGVRIWDAQSGKPVSEPIEYFGVVKTAVFSPDQRRVLIGGTRAQILDVADNLDSTLPPWVPELIEALGGQKLKAGLLEPAAKSIPQLRKDLMGSASRNFLKGDDFWSRFGRWFFTRGLERTISPDSKITVGELENMRARTQPATEP